MPTFTKIATASQFRDYIKQTLGYPVINIEVNNDQIDQIVIDVCQDFARYNYDEGSYRDYIIFTTSAGIDEYTLSASNIQDVYDLQLSFGVDGINTLFSPTHELLYKDWVVKGNYPGGNNQPGMVMADYDISMMYLAEIKRHFGREYLVDWVPGKEVLRLTPTPREASIGVLLVYRAQEAVNMYNNPLVKKLGVARTKILWGRNIGKYAMTLPGGGTINGMEIMNEGKEEEKEIMDRFYTEGPPVDFFLG